MEQLESQDSPAEVIQRERQLVRQLTGLTDDAGLAFVDSGWTSRVYVCNGGEWVLKFPRSERVKREYGRERRVLELLERVDTSVQVPRLRWTDADNAYLGYAGIVGVELASHQAELALTGKQAVGESLGGFLRALHDLTLPDLRTISVRDEITELQEKYELVRPVIERAFTAREQQQLDRLVARRLPEELASLGEDLALCHGDLGYWNVIRKPDGGIGIIDWGDAGYYDRSKDFMAIEDPQLLGAALHAYGDSDNLRAKIATRQTVLYLLDLPFFVGKRDEAGIAKTVAKIRSAL